MCCIRRVSRSLYRGVILCGDAVVEPRRGVIGRWHTCDRLLPRRRVAGSKQNPVWRIPRPSWASP